MVWVLILFAHVGVFGNTDSNALSTVDGFVTQAQCKAAGEAAKKLAAGTKKEIRFACVERGR